MCFLHIGNTELIKYVQLCDVEENKESEEDRENVSCPYCQELFSNSIYVLRPMVSAFCRELFSQMEGMMTHMEEH